MKDTFTESTREYEQGFPPCDASVTIHVRQWDRKLVSATWDGSTQSIVRIPQEWVDDYTGDGYCRLIDRSRANEALRTMFPWRLRVIDFDLPSLTYLCMRDDALWRMTWLRLHMPRWIASLRWKCRKTWQIWKPKDWAV